MNQMTLPSRHRIGNSSFGRLWPITPHLRQQLIFNSGKNILKSEYQNSGRTHISPGLTFIRSNHYTRIPAMTTQIVVIHQPEKWMCLHPPVAVRAFSDIDGVLHVPTHTYDTFIIHARSAILSRAGGPS